MLILPAIDLKSGKCVRLYQGDFNQMTCYNANPFVQAEIFATAGSSWLHIVDLDGAEQGKPIQTELIADLKKASHLNIQTGGGIRQRVDIENLLNQGIDRVIIGSLALTKPKLVQMWIEQFGIERIVLALDIYFKQNTPYIATQGWRNKTDVSLWELLDAYTHLKHVLCTDISRDGTLAGPNIAFYLNCKMRYPSLCFQVSGGIASLDDLTLLKKQDLAAVIIGKALYEKKFALQEALQC